MRRLGLILVCSGVLFSGVVSAADIGKKKFGDWYTLVEKDRFTDESTVESFVFGEKVFGDYTSVGMRCLRGEIRLTFDTVRYVSFNGSDVNIRYRVDKEDTGSMLGMTYSNANDAGFSIGEMSGSLVEQMKKGSSILLEVSNKRRSNIHTYDFSLRGFTKAYNRMKRNCS